MKKLEGMGNIDLVMEQPTLLQQVEKVLNKKLSAQPKNNKLLWRLAETLRQQGLLRQASSIYRRIASDSSLYEKACLLSAIMDQGSQWKSFQTQARLPPLS